VVTQDLGRWLKRDTIAAAMKRTSSNSYPRSTKKHRRQSYNIIDNSIYSQPSRLLLSYTFVITLCMLGHRLTQSEYALQQVVESSGNLLFSLEEHHLTHTYCVVFHFCELENIDYMVLRYLDTGALPFKEFSGDWLFDGECNGPGRM